MLAGLVVDNEMGSLQISDKHTTLQIVDIRDVAAQSGRSSFDVYAIQPVKGGAAMAYNINIGSGKVFDIANTEKQASTQGSGLEVFNESGDLSYSSLLRNVRVIDRAKATLKTNTNDNIFSKNYGNKEIAVIFMQLASWSLPISADGGPVATIFCSLSTNNTLTMRSQITPFFNPSSRNVQVFNENTEFLVIDVTGY